MRDYKEKYEHLLKQYELLKEENARLCEMLNLLSETAEKNTSAQKAEALDEKRSGVTMQSPTAEKIALFRSLFKGRDDVFARRWFNAKTGKSGYSPVCANEWNPVLCNKRAVKCAECRNRAYLRLDDKTIETHLKGASETYSDVIGIYPLLEGDACNFLAIDFDGEGWQEDIAAVRAVCKEKNLFVSVERSRSGDGGHLWIFFESTVSTALARKFGCVLLTAAMEQRHEIKFTSYDRLFPNQDYVPTGGLGNLIALPLQGRARREGNSVFVDEKFNVYPDQWAYLSSIEKITENQIEKILSETGSEIGEFDGSGDGEKQPAKSEKNKLNAFDFPLTVNAYLSNMLYIEKKGISECALDKIKRLAAFHNPDYYKAQKLRLSIYNKPRIISTYEETDEHIALPRGCLSAFKDLLYGLNVNLVCDDRRNSGIPIEVEFNGALRENQIPAFNALAAAETGVLSATTAFGKTVIGARLIAERKVNCLVLVHSTALLNQWKQALSRFLSLYNPMPQTTVKRGRKREQSPIGQLGATQNTLNGYVDIAIMQSLVNGGEVKECIKDYGMIIVDECHHVPAVSFECVMKAAEAKYIYGLTATPQRQDGRQKIIYQQCGDIRYRVDAKEQAATSGFAHTVIPRFTFFRMPLGAGKLNIQRAFEKISESKTRNSLIVKDILKAVRENRNILVLTERRSHAEILERKISAAGIETFLLIGAESAKIKREKLAKIAEKENSGQFVIVATGKYIGEGFDSARLDTLFLTMPISWKGKLAQYVGRLHRICESKKEVIVYDYVDVNVGMLENMYRKRISGYRSLGYEIMVEEEGKKSDILFDKFNYMPIFQEDILSAKKSILIVCPKLRINYVEKFLKAIDMLNEQPHITVVTGAYVQGDNVGESCLEKLKRAGASVRLKEDMHSNFAIIDSCLIWYGSISYLSYSSADDTALRFESFETARELRGVVE